MTLDFPPPPSAVSAVDLIVPQLQELQSQAVLLDEYEGDQAQRVSAALEVLRAMRDLTVSTRRWVSQFDFEPAVIDPADELENTSLLFSLGERLHEAARRAGAVWPPPYGNPPPAAVRDLMALYEMAKLPPDAEGLVSARLDRSLQFLHSRIVDLIKDLEYSSTNARMLALETTTASFGRSNRSTPATKAVQLATAASIVISLMQGPGAINRFAEDVAELHGDLQTVTSQLASGLANQVEERARELGFVWDLGSTSDGSG